jgi:hypothetical protein
VNNETSPEEYWASVSEEVGEPVRAYALARLMNVAGPETPSMFGPKQEWGLVFMTDSTLYVERSSSQSWIQRLITTRQKEETSERKAIPIDSMTKVIVPPPKSGLGKFFGSPEVVVEIQYDQTPGLIRLVLDRRGKHDKTLIDLLSGVGQENA